MVYYKSLTKTTESVILSVLGLSTKFAKKTKSFPFLQIKYNLEQTNDGLVSYHFTTKTTFVLFGLLFST